MFQKTDIYHSSTDCLETFFVCRFPLPGLKRGFAHGHAGQLLASGSGRWRGQHLAVGRAQKILWRLDCSGLESLSLFPWHYSPHHVTPEYSHCQHWKQWGHPTWRLLLLDSLVVPHLHPIVFLRQAFLSEGNCFYLRVALLKDCKGLNSEGLVIFTAFS